MSGEITRIVVTDDDGSATTGTVFDNAKLQQVFDIVESVAGDAKAIGGDPNDAISQVAYPSGAGLDKLHRGTAVWVIDSVKLHGVYQFEGVGYVDSGTTLTVALVNLTDGTPDTPVASFTITATVATRGVSGSITLPGGGVAKTYGVKVKVDVGEGFIWGLNIFRAGS